MMVSRYISTLVAIFDNNEKHPYWECDIEKTPDCGYKYIFGDLDTYNVSEMVWDCKKKELIDAFYIIKKDFAYAVGQKVAVERFPKIYIETISDIEWDETDAEYYYKKTKEYTAELLKRDGIPPDAKLICIKILKPIVKFASGRESVHSVYIKELADD